MILQGEESWEFRKLKGKMNNTVSKYCGHYVLYIKENAWNSKSLIKQALHSHEKSKSIQ